MRRRRSGWRARGREGPALEADLAPARRIEPDREARDRGLAAAALAHERQRGATRDREGYVIDGAQRATRLARQRALQPRLRDVEQFGDPDGLDIGAGPASTHAPEPQACARTSLIAHRSGLGVEPTGGAGGARLQKLRPLHAATAEHPGTARVERASGRDPVDARHRAVDLPQPLELMLDRGDAAHQPFGVGMRGPLHDFRTGPISTDAARIHDKHPVGGLGDHAHVVRHQHHCRPVIAREPLEQSDDLRLDRYIQRRRRLVRDHQARLGAERERDHDALPHSAREFVRIGVDPLAGGRELRPAPAIHRALPRAPPVRQPRWVCIVSASCRPTE